MHELNGLLSKVESLREKSSRLAKPPKFSRVAIRFTNSKIESEKVISELQDYFSSEQIKFGWLRTQSSLIYLPKQLSLEDGMPLSGEWVTFIDDKPMAKHLNYISDGKWSLTTWKERQLDANETIEDGEHEVLSQKIKLLGTDKNEFTYHVYWKGTETDLSAIDRFGARLVSIDEKVSKLDG